MRTLLLVAYVLPSFALATSTDHGGRMLRPTSYVMTLIRESKLGQVHDPNLRPYPLFPGVDPTGGNGLVERGALA